MDKELLGSISLAGLLAASVAQGAVAAPMVRGGSATIASADSRLMQQIYYYHGRYYSIPLSS